MNQLYMKHYPIAIPRLPGHHNRYYKKSFRGINRANNLGLKIIRETRIIVNNNIYKDICRKMDSSGQYNN